MKHLIIIGARGWGREVYAAAMGTKAYRNGEYDIKGFLDSKSDAFAGLRGNYPPILGAPEDYEIQENDVFFVAMGEPKWRKHYAELMEAKGAKFMSIIDDCAYVNPTAHVGEGTYISGWTAISDNVKLGKHSIIHVFCDLGHDAKVGDYSSIEAYTFMGGGSEIGDESVAHVRSHILPHKKVGNSCSIGASSVVMRNVPDGQHVMGNPAKKIEF